MWRNAALGAIVGFWCWCSILRTVSWLSLLFLFAFCGVLSHNERKVFSSSASRFLAFWMLRRVTLGGCVRPSVRPCVRNAFSKTRARRICYCRYRPCWCNVTKECLSVGPSVTPFHGRRNDRLIDSAHLLQTGQYGPRDSFVRLCAFALVHSIMIKAEYLALDASRRRLREGVSDVRTDRRMDRRTDRRTDGRTDPLIEMRGRI